MRHKSKCEYSSTRVNHKKHTVPNASQGWSIAERYVNIIHNGKDSRPLGYEMVRMLRLTTLQNTSESYTFKICTDYMYIRIVYILYLQ